MKRQKGVDRRMKLNRTTQRTIEILELISQKPEGVSLDELCDRLELPKTSAYDIVTTLGAEEAVYHRAHGISHRH